MKLNKIAISSISILILTIFLLFALHDSAKREVIDKFKAQQLITAKLLSKEIESCLRDESHAIEVFSSFEELKNKNKSAIASKVEEYYKYSKKNHVKSVNVYNENGAILYSTSENAAAFLKSDSDIFIWAAKRENKGKQSITSELPSTPLQSGKSSIFQVMIIAPVYSELGSVHVKTKNLKQKEPGDKFVGIIYCIIDLDEILKPFFLIDSSHGMNEHAWILDDNGTVKYQSEHPQMVLNNIHQQKESCLKCHESFKHVETILSKTEGTIEYRLKNRSQKLASYTSLDFKNISWRVVVNIPLDEITSFVDKNLIQTLALFVIIILTLLGYSFAIFRSNRSKLKSEMETEKLRANQAFNLILESAGVGIFGLDLQGNHTFVNPKAASLLGYRIDELIGKHSHTTWHHTRPNGDPYPSSECRIYATLNEGISHNGEEYFWRKDGSGFTVYFSSTPILEDGKVAGSVVTFRDISESKRAELERQVMYEVMHSVTTIDNLDDLLKSILQSLGKVLSADNCFVALHDQNTGLFSFPLFIDKFDPTPEPIATLKSCAAYVYRLGKPLLISPELFDQLAKQNEVEQVGSGSLSWVGVPLQTPSKIWGVLVLQNYDIENVYDEHDVNYLTLIGNQIAVAIERKMDEEEIQKRNRQLSRINSEKDKFFSIIAHDLKGPFQGLIGLTRDMATESNELSSIEITTYSNELYKCVLNLYKLLENLLEWAKVQQGLTDFTPQKLRLSDIFTQSMEEIYQRALQKEITIHNEILESIEIYADEKMINSVLRNLLSNAVKYTRKGGIVVGKAREIEKEMVEISVTDTGVGISPENVMNLFKLGKKVRTSGTEDEPSTGLGLLLCKEFVEKQRGKIWVESHEDIGSTFYFTIPEADKNNT